MTTPDGFTLTMLEETAKVLPASAWDKLATTACTTFEQALAPLTTTTSGIGRWITARFDRFVEMEKFNAAEALKRAKEKIEASGKPMNPNLNAKVIMLALEGAAMEAHQELREAWAGLLASEFTTGGVHPMIPGILAQMTVADANRLSEITSTGGIPMSAIAYSRSLAPEDIAADQDKLAELFRSKETLSEAALTTLGLIRKGSYGLQRTPLGVAFIEAVSGPAVELEPPGK